jgi:glycine cleavage system H protein
MNIPKNFFYTSDHEWAQVDGETATIGLTAHAVEQLGGVTFIELPAEGEELTQFKPFAEIESVKAVSDIYAPVSGRVVEINQDLSTAPDAIEQDPYGNGWICRIEISDAGEIEDLMSADEYAKYLEQDG